MDQEIREPVVAYGKKNFTIEEYLEYENASDENMSTIGARFLQCRAPNWLTILLL